MFPVVQENLLYEPLDESGVGVQNAICKGRDRTNGQLVIMKKVNILMSLHGMPANILREIAMLKALSQHQHANIIRLLDIVQGPRSIIDNSMIIYMIFEHTEQDLATYIANCPQSGFPPGTIKSIMKQLLSGVDFLQCNRVTHQDLKPTNILMTNDLRIKISNFGISKIYDVRMTVTSLAETLWYRSPEVLLKMPYSSAMDVWSCGCIMAELYLLAPLFPGQSDIEQLHKIFRVIGLPSEEMWPAGSSMPRSVFQAHLPVCFRTLIPQLCFNGKDLLKKFLNFKGSKRVTAFNALQHPYFDGVDG